MVSVCFCQRFPLSEFFRFGCEFYRGLIECLHFRNDGQEPFVVTLSLERTVFRGGEVRAALSACVCAVRAAS